MTELTVEDLEQLIDIMCEVDSSSEFIHLVNKLGKILEEKKKA